MLCCCSIPHFCESACAGTDGVDGAGGGASGGRGACCGVAGVDVEVGVCESRRNAQKN